MTIQFLLEDLSKRKFLPAFAVFQVPTIQNEYTKLASLGVACPATLQ